LTIPSWVYYQAVLLLGLLALLVGWSVLCQWVGRARARAGDYAGADRWYQLTFNHRHRMGGRINIAAAQVLAGDPVTAEGTFRQVFDDSRRRRDRRLERLSLVNLGASLIAQGRTVEATPILEWVVLGRPGERRRERAAALYNLAWIAFLDGDFEGAGRRTAVARGATRRPGSDLACLITLMEARLATRAGRFEEARRSLALAERHARTAVDRGLADQVRIAEGVLDYRRGDREQGLATALAGAGGVRRADRRDLAARWLSGLAHIAGEQGDEAGAARLEPVAAGLRGMLPIPSPEDCAAYLKA
jgi:tetratricopeptide (TPR) repeat protein